ncbi:MAG: hypothetical protein ACJ71W_00215 [Terriglobales bacterium]
MKMLPRRPAATRTAIPPHTSRFTYDSYWCPRSATAPPDPGNSNLQDTTTFTYALSLLMVTRQKSVTSTLNDSASEYFDGVGRGFKSTNTLPNGTAPTVTSFDAAGRVLSVTIRDRRPGAK